MFGDSHESTVEDFRADAADSAETREPCGECAGTGIIRGFNRNTGRDFAHDCYACHGYGYSVDFGIAGTR